MRKLSWLKDSLIQIIFISFAVVFTVFIAQISLSEQYVAYYEGKLEEKTETLARNAALYFTNSEINNAAGINFVLNVIFPSENLEGDLETISYILYEPDGQIAASSIGDLELPQPALQAAFGQRTSYTYMESPVVRSFYPIEIEGSVRYILMVQIDDTPFLEYGGEMSQSLYSSLFRGCLMMAGGYLLFSVISNLKKKKKPDDEQLTMDNGQLTIDDNPEKQQEKRARLIMQFVSLFFTGVLALVALWAYNTYETTAAFTVLILFAATAALHLLRVLLWFFAWYSKRPISSYAAQTMQFFVFLVVFLAMYVFSIQSGYNTQTEMMAQNELRLSSMFAGLSLTGREAPAGDFSEILEAAEALDFGEHRENLIIIRDGDSFSVFGSDIDVSYANDLFFSAWETQSSVTGIRGDYKYGVTVIADSEFNIHALAIVRQLTTIQADEMRGTQIDFLLAMSATVFAFVFLFVELNRILEVVNLPNLKRERELRYAKVTRSLMFLANACRYIPLYFFILIVRDIYAVNPVAWLPSEIAMVLPIAVVLIIMAVGRDFARVFLRLKARKLMILGCIIGLIGFLTLNSAATLPALLLLLTFTYTGLSMVYNGLWDFAQEAADTSYSEFDDIKEQVLSGEFLGGTAGAVIGAMVYDKFGLFAAFALSSGILFVLIILIRGMLPAGERAVKAEKGEIGFFRFFFSRSIFLFMFFLLMPFVLGEYFIEQFSPLYAASIELSPGAASWTSLIMTMAIAYIAPTFVRMFGSSYKTAVCIFANILAGGGLVLFAFMPGLVTMYATSAIIGLSIGIGKNIFAAKYAEYYETDIYAHSGSVYNLFDSLFGLLGAALFTLAFTLFY
jgi:hypothetical protein